MLRRSVRPGSLHAAVLSARDAASRVSPLPALRLLVLLLPILPAVFPAPGFPGAASAQGRWVDIGSGVGFTIAVEGEPESRAIYPPYAFGTFSPGNLVYLELLPWACSGLPDPAVCAGATFVRAFQSYLDTGSCPCTGVLFAPAELELRYDAARVQALGAREEDLRLVLYDGDLLEWVELPAQRVLPERDLILGNQEGTARQFLAILARPRPASTWGRIKAQWTDPR